VKTRSLWLFVVRWGAWKCNTLQPHKGAALAWFLRIHPEALPQLERVFVDSVRSPLL
jgi:hypothetical protein